MTDLNRNSLLITVVLIAFGAFFMTGVQMYIGSNYVPREVLETKLNDCITEIRWRGTEIQYKKAGKWHNADEARGEQIYRAFGKDNKEPQ